MIVGAAGAAAAAMRRFGLAVALAAGGAALAAGGCGHTHSVGSAEKEGAQAGQDQERGHKQPPEDRAARPPSQPTAHDAPPSDPATRDRTKADIPIATSPQGLMQPGAEKKIQEKLASQGLLDGDKPSGELDGPTREALRRFQRSSGLPATGVPDDATARKLGLDPNDLFRAGAAPKQ